MDVYQLKTFVAVARAGSITRAAEVVHLSQPAVSAHIKAIEEAFGLTLFERTPRGMALTPEGERLLARAEQMLAAHQALMDEAARLKGRVAGTLRIGTVLNSKNDIIGSLLTALAGRFPGIEVVLEHATSNDILSGLRGGRLDGGFYNDAGTPDPALTVTEVSSFTIYVVAPFGFETGGEGIDWKALAEVPWIYPDPSTCCGQTAEHLFETYGFRPKRILRVDREDLTRTMVARGAGVGLLHADTAKEAAARGEVKLLHESRTPVRVLFAHLASRSGDPLLAAATSVFRSGLETP
ncbi:MAG: LysR family transcriptional regulator [Myxococcaceae bacterium]|nr:LysR family transcriptional regulator [Myxococcaceae bacterium]